MDLLAISVLIGFNVLLGLNQALVKLVNEGFSHIFQAGLRSACAFVPVLVFALFMKRRWRYCQAMVSVCTLSLLMSSSVE